MDQWEEERQREREARRARHQRDSDDDDDERRGRRKERVLHTRISEELHGAIRRAADDLRVPVSNLVRNALEDVFRAVDDVSETVSDFVGDVVSEVEDIRSRIREERAGRRPKGEEAAEHAAEEAAWASRHDPIGHEAGERRTARGDRPAFEDVAGWQPLVLNRSQICGDCATDLAANADAYLGVSSTGRPPVFLCKDCLDARGT